MWKWIRAAPIVFWIGRLPCTIWSSAPLLLIVGQRLGWLSDRRWDWLNLLSHRLESEGWSNAATLCWAIWRARNGRVWKNKVAVANDIVVAAKLELDQWRNAKEKGGFLPLTVPGDRDGVVHWSKPERNTIKVNVDAATFADTSSFGAGWIARDSERNVLEAGTATKGGPVSSGVAEAVGVQEARSAGSRRKDGSM